jgi:hypothetical protein
VSSNEYDYWTGLGGPSERRLLEPFLSFEVTDEVIPLGEQFGVYPLVTVPEMLQRPLFGNETDGSDEGAPYTYVSSVQSSFSIKRMKSRLADVPTPACFREKSEWNEGMKLLMLFNSMPKLILPAVS